MGTLATSVPTPKKVIVIYVTDRETALEAVSNLISRNITCVDVLEYSANMHYADYVSGLEAEGRPPLLFLFSLHHHMLVRSLDDLAAVLLKLKDNAQ